MHREFGVSGGQGVEEIHITLQLWGQRLCRTVRRRSSGTIQDFSVRPGELADRNRSLAGQPLDVVVGARHHTKLVVSNRCFVSGKRTQQ
jgi:hypothetical protein